MEIGEVIRENRKKLDLTQEEMARRLGVTTPAVNKWENGKSLPDITLLAPIARLLDITLDDLLSFRENPTNEEINNIIQELNKLLKIRTYDEVFLWAKEKINKFPNSDILIWQIAVILDSWRFMKEIANPEDYDIYINEYYKRVLKSKDEKIRIKAADSLFHFYLRKEEYDEAEVYLQYFSEENPERKIREGVIYSKTNRINEAYKAYEETLYTSYGILNNVLNYLYILAMKEENKDKAYFFVNKRRELAHIFEMGKYHEISPFLEIVTSKEDIEETIKIAEGIINSFDTIYDFRKSILYEHMKFKNMEEETGFLKEMKDDVLEFFRDEKMFYYMKNNEKWEKLIN